MSLKYIKTITKFEDRELTLKEYNSATGYILYNLKVPQAIEINLVLTPSEIEWLYATHKTIKKILKKSTKKEIYET